MSLQSSPDCQSQATFSTLRGKLGTAALALILACSLVGCTSFSPQTTSTHTATGATSHITISPSSATVTSGSKIQLIATITNTRETAVVWSASSGVVLDNGMFTAPSITTAADVYVTARTAQAPFNAAIAVLKIVPKTALTITTHALAAVSSGAPYTATLTATGGTSPYSWAIAGGSLPSGLSIDRTSGLISGTPTRTGTFGFTVSVTDANAITTSQPLTLAVNAPAVTPAVSGNFDGPAELPRVYVQSSLSNTPAPGTVTQVPLRGDLQSALNRANCGDTIELQSGATYSGVFTFPAKTCTDSNWIIVRTNAPDSVLPPEGTRISPCYAGVTSLPGRPAFNCTSTQNVMAKLLMGPFGTNGPVIFASGANHYRLIGLEITRPQASGLVNALATVQSGGTMDHVIFDRVWMHGTAQDETTRGLELGGSAYVSLLDSYLTDFHCVAMTGSCGDAQAIYGGLGNNPMGPYQIVDNFLEASGENILLGGGAATFTPADIEIRRNHMFKPLTWMKGQPGYVGGVNGNPFVVKNLFELKNAQRVLLDGNTMENSWGGFSQVGYAILLTPKNQAIGTQNICPDCQVTDVTIRNTRISHVGAGMQIANAYSDNGGIPRAGERYSIHDVIIDDIDGTKYNGPGQFAQVSMGRGTPLLHDITINHVTAFAPARLFMVGDDTTVNPPMKNFVFTNNIVTTGAYPVWSTGGGQINCAYHDSPLTTFNNCFSPYAFAANALVTSGSNFPASKWPSGNFVLGSPAAVQFVDYHGGIGGDYHLQTSSPYKGAASDGKDLGADVDAVYAATASAY